MKKSFISGLLITSITINSQVNQRVFDINTSSKFDTIKSKLESYYVNFPDTSKDGADEEFERWEHFWRNRVQSPVISEQGSYVPALKALHAQLNSPLCTSINYQANWTNLGPGITPSNDNVIGRVNCVAFDPVNPNIFYAGTGNSGLWRTTNGGISWNCLTESLRLPGLGIQAIAINLSNITGNKDIYIATGIVSLANYGIGILKSIDGGNSWQTTGLTYDPITNPNSYVAFSVKIDPLNPNIVYAGVSDKLYKTTDGGITWQIVFTITKSRLFPGNTLPCIDPVFCTDVTRNIIDIEFHPNNSQIIYISTNNMENAANNCVASCGGALIGGNGGAELWKSVDGGATWIELTAVTSGASNLSSINPFIEYSDKINIEVSPAEPNSLFISWGSGMKAKFYTTKSTDGGLTWSIPNPCSFNNYDPYLVSPTHPNEQYTGFLQCYKTFNGGVTWLGPLSDYLPLSGGGAVLGGHADLRGMAIRNITGVDEILMGNDGGVNYQPNGHIVGDPLYPPIVWQNVSKTLPINEFYGLASSEVDENLIIAGAQDNGVHTYNNGNWTYQIIGDAYECAFDYKDPNVCYSESNGGAIGLYKSINKGASWFGITQPSLIALNTRPIENHKNNKNIYIGYDNVYTSVSDNAYNNTWIKKSDFNTHFNNGRPLQSIAVSESNPNIIYAIKEGLSYGSAPTLYFFRSTTGGGTNINDWTDITSNVAASSLIFNYLPATCIEVNPYKENELWIGAGGVYNPGNVQRVLHSTDYGNTWVDYSTGLPPFPVHKIVYEKGSNDALYAATDVGVFYRNKSMTQWECFNNNLPVVIVTDLEINYKSNTLRASTYGRGVWISSLACPTAPSNINDYNISYGGSNIFKETKYNIFSNAEIVFNSNITYRAGMEINLYAGFKANANSDNSSFHAFIHNCDAVGNSFRITSSPSNKSDIIGSFDNTIIQTKSIKPIDSGIFVKPNPNNGLFELTKVHKTDYDFIEIYDVKGQLVLRRDYKTSQDSLFNISTFADGLYLVKVYTQGKSEIVKFLKN